MKPGYVSTRAYLRGPKAQIIGDLAVIDTKPGELTQEVEDLLVDLGGIVESLLRLLTLSSRDHLTRLLNRRYFDQALDLEWRRACRVQLPIALLFIDLDDFKAYNDVYGHQAGDECLRKVAGILWDNCKRSGDLPFRLGGEEFAILLAMTSTESGALRFAEELLQDIRDLGIPHKGSDAGVVTASIGVATADADSLPEDASRQKDFVKASDEALYAAKNAGRNTVAAEKFG